MEYLYCFANVSLTLRLLEYLDRPQLPLNFVSVVYHHESWIVRIKMQFPLSLQQEGDFRSVLNELGIPAHPPKPIQLALQQLEAGLSPTRVMRRYRVVIVSHGFPQREEIDVFRQQFIEGLGYCPRHLV